MAAATFVFVILHRTGRMDVLLSRNPAYEVSKLRTAGRIKVILLEPFETAREAIARHFELKSISKKALRAIIRKINPETTDLIPDFVLSGSPPGSMPMNDVLRQILEDGEDPDFGNGGITAKLPHSPRPLSGAAANPIPDGDDELDFLEAELHLDSHPDWMYRR